MPTIRVVFLGRGELTSEYSVTWVRVRVKVRVGVRVIGVIVRVPVRVRVRVRVRVGVRVARNQLTQIESEFLWKFIFIGIGSHFRFASFYRI